MLKMRGSPNQKIWAAVDGASYTGMKDNIWGMEHTQLAKIHGILGSPVFTPHPAPPKNMFESSHFKPPIWQQCQHHDAPAAPKWCDTEADNGATIEDHKADNEAIYQLRISAILYILYIYI